jgi:hypothetical protein
VHGCWPGCGAGGIRGTRVGERGEKQWLGFEGG